MSRISGPLNRMTVINLLEEQHKLSRVITESLCHYMEQTRRYQEDQRVQISLSLIDASDLLDSF